MEPLGLFEPSADVDGVLVLKANETLGRLESVQLREIWTSESNDFTPWLAQEENLAVLGETLDLELELEAQERSVGPFRADILCRDTVTSEWVLIENQLERTDHAHLGQLLTYASGLEAVTIVWIAALFNEEHRATLDWLNAITEERFRFFGLEVELWRIGESAAAPKFNIVSKPNDWSKSVAKGSRSLDGGELSEVRAMQLEYWEALNSVLDDIGGPVRGNRKPQALSYMSYAIGRTNFRLNAVMGRPQRRVRAQLEIWGRDARTYVEQLREQEAMIQADLGQELEWETFSVHNYVSINLNEHDPEDREDWPQQHQWLATNLNKLHEVFSDRVRRLEV